MLILKTMENEKLVMKNIYHVISLDYSMGTDVYWFVVIFDYTYMFNCEAILINSYRSYNTVQKVWLYYTIECTVFLFFSLMKGYLQESKQKNSVKFFLSFIRTNY